jgi:tetratricopeptide (TPR) repeat protein
MGPHSVTIASLILFALSVRADATTIDHEKFSVLNWGDGCSVAVSRESYVEGFPATPRATKLSVIVWAAGQHAPKEDSWESVTTEETAKIAAVLARHGYVMRGFPEEIRDAALPEESGVSGVGLSTQTLRAVSALPYPGSNWRVADINYDPSGDCALLIYEEKRIGKPFYDCRLVRVNNADVRVDRAEAHLRGGLLLFQQGDLAGALAETAIAAALDPESAPARYHHAAMLALSGKVEPAVDELAAAVALDSSFKDKARVDMDFETVRSNARFQSVTSL